MTEPEGMNIAMMDGGVATSREASTLFLSCHVCESDAGDTLGVAGPEKTGSDASVVMRCQSCGTVYLSPFAVAETDSPTPAIVLAGLRRAARYIRRHAADKRVLAIDDANSLPETGRFDRILLPWTLEQARDPTEALRQAAKLLADDGRIVVFAGNAESACFGVFGERHWSGYGRPGTRRQFTHAALAWMSETSGLAARHIRTAYDSASWLDSARRWLQDWSAGPLAVACVTGPWLVPQAVAAVLESIAVLRGRGALLVAELARR